MNQLLADPIARKHQRDIAAIIGSRKWTLLKVVSALCLALLVAYFASSFELNSNKNGRSFDNVRRDLARSGVLTDREYLSQHEDYRRWLKLHATSSEQTIFDSVSHSVFISATSLADGRNSFENASFFKSIYLALHFAFIRVLFVLLASWRLWLFVSILAIIWEYFSFKVYTGDDFLGQTGNGRLFFSGVQISLAPNNSSGAPETQVTGLACPKSVSKSKIDKSEIIRILTKFSADNETNRALVGIILAHSHYPSYIAKSDEALLLEAAYEGSTLGDSTATLLTKALELHQKYRAMQLGNEKFDELEQHQTAQIENDQRKLNLSEYSQRLQVCMHRVLSHEMRTHLAELRPNELATLVLAYEAGKSLAFNKEVGGWVRKSSFPQLSARAVLHSIPAYAKDYNFDQRSTLRRALIFASRSSVFAPVRFPIDMSDQSAAARQWIELLLACPHELQAAADEIELVGILSEAHKSWARLFLDGAMAMDPEVVDDVYATPTNLLFMPVTKVLSLLRKVVEHGTLRRMEELIARVSQHQRLQSMSLDFSSENSNINDKSSLGAADRIFTPLAHREIKALSAEHGLSVADVRDWSSLRVILNSFSWLGRRVGDYTVPESSIISVVLKVDPAMPGSNEHGRIGKHGMVAFRGTRLYSKWGQFWQTRFISVSGVTMAETAHDYEQLILGIEKSIDDIEAFDNATGTDLTKV